MPISAMDETLAHQTAGTFDQVYTSDRNFYDRYYFNLHPKSGDLFVAIAPDGTVTIVAHRSEMGTGIRTGLRLFLIVYLVSPNLMIHLPDCT